MINKIGKVVMALMLIWALMCTIDYLRTNNEKKPLFCIKEENKKYNDGIVYICTATGYKYYEYKRNSYNNKTFGGFWLKEYNPFN